MTEIRRTLGTRDIEAGSARVLTISQVYDTDQDDLWETVTEPERIQRWFLPVTGELKEGGSYQLEGNAGGTVSRCDKPDSFAATWEFGGQVTYIEVRLTPAGPGRTRLELEHFGVVDEDFWNQFGPGATGIGWDLALNGLALHLRDPGTKVDPAQFEAWTRSGEGQAFMRRSSDGWVEQAIADGEDPATARSRGDRVYAFYTGAQPSAPES